MDPLVTTGMAVGLMALQRIVLATESPLNSKREEIRFVYTLVHIHERIAELSFNTISRNRCNGSDHKELPMIIDDRIIPARYDTGAEGNIISRRLAESYNLNIQPVDPGSGVFQLANGKIVSSIGQVSTICSFALDKAVSTSCSFYVWENLAGPGMIMGRKFLEATKTLSSFSYRLRQRTTAFKMPMLHEISSTTDELSTRLLCSIDSQQIFVTPDTGSDLDVMSQRFAQQSGYKINTKVRKKVQLGDGTVVETIGQIHDVLVSIEEKSYHKTFDVLPGLASDVILGELTLGELNAYTELEHLFERFDFGPREYEMCTIILLGIIGDFLKKTLSKKESKLKRGLPPEPNPNPASQGYTNNNQPPTLNTTSDSLLKQIDNLDQRELDRRDAAERFVKTLDGKDPAAKQTAELNESLNRHFYEAERQRLLQTLATLQTPAS